MLNRIPKTALPLLGLFLLLGIYWLYWSSLTDRLKDEVKAWAQAQQSQNINVTWDALRATGFPLRLRLEFDNLRYDASATTTPWSLTTPEFHAHALPYRLNHVIAAARSPMQLTYGSGDQMQSWEVTAESTEASYVAQDDAPARLALDIQTLLATRLDRPASFAAGRLQMHARKAMDEAGAVDIALRGANIAPGRELAPGLIDLLGPVASHIGIQARVTAKAGDSVFRDVALLQRDGSTVQISQGTVTWGETGASGSGKMEIAADGTSNGRFDTTLKGYDAIIDGLVRQKLVSSDLKGTLKAAMSLLSLTSGAGAGQVRMPLIVRDSEVYLGPVRLAR